MKHLGRDTLLLGAQMDDATARTAPFDLRYLYLAGGLFDSRTPCTSCGGACRAGGRSCQGGACAWWGCWQDPTHPPGEYLRRFFERAAAQQQIPLVTYYELLHASGVKEGAAEVSALADRALMTRYFADWRFLLQQVGDRTVLLHLEPDLWGYIQQLGQDPATLPASVASANPTDCGELPDTVASVGRCLIRMVRRYAPNARVGLHASFWGTNVDVSLNRDPRLDVAAQAEETARTLRALGAGEGDFIVVGASDRDAGWYQARGQNRWWDASDRTLPNFRQALRWAGAVSDGLKLPVLWWQLPVGNPSLPDRDGAWRDNRLDYFLGHPDRVAAAHAFGMVFGAGKKGLTTPSSDGGHFVRSAQKYLSGPRPVLCR